MQPGFGSSPHRLWEGLNPSHDTAWKTRRVAQLASICSISRQEQHCVHEIYPAADPDCVRAENSPLCFHLHFSTEILWEFRSNQNIYYRFWLTLCFPVALSCCLACLRCRMRQVWRSLALAEIFPLKTPKHEERATHKVAAFLLWLLQTLNRHCCSLMREKTQRRLQTSLCLSW